jgi:hypothetical protein
MSDRVPYDDFETLDDIFEGMSETEVRKWAENSFLRDAESSDRGLLKYAKKTIDDFVKNHHKET